MKLVRLTTTLFLLFFIISLLSFAQNDNREGAITFLKRTCLLKRDGEEYNRLSKIISKIDEAERKLMKVLYVLNKKYDELNKKSN